MSFFEKFSCGELQMKKGSARIDIVPIGNVTTRATALAIAPNAPIGSLYVGDTKLYHRTAATAGNATATDLTLVTESAAD